MEVAASVPEHLISLFRLNYLIFFSQGVPRKSGRKKREVKPDVKNARLWVTNCSKTQHAFSLAVGLGFSGKRKQAELPTDRQVGKGISVALNLTSRTSN